jgi:hypothetical protein
MVQEFLADRYRMYADVYTCTATQAIEVMVVDALVAAEPDLGIKERACSVQEFLSLDDSLVDGIIHLARAAAGSFFFSSWLMCNVKQVAHGHPRWGKGCGVLGESAHRSVKLTHAPRGYAFRPKGHLQPP